MKACTNIKDRQAWSYQNNLEYDLNHLVNKVKESWLVAAFVYSPITLPTGNMGGVKWHRLLRKASTYFPFWADCS